MTAATVVSYGDNTLTNERVLRIDNLTVTSDYTYTPSNPTGQTLKVIAAYDSAGAIVKTTVTANVITLDNGGSLSGTDVMIMYTFV